GFYGWKMRVFTVGAAVASWSSLLQEEGTQEVPPTECPRRQVMVNTIRVFAQARLALIWQ
ncbi:hypothetical protein J4G08_19285, partial [Candidatus Poribacteria bacterium]|nr:hypothetical protein [Candidatus Poribacteria bacterium]